MIQMKYHGILVNMGFSVPTFPERFSIFNRKEAGDWILYGIEITPESLDKSIEEIKENMRSDENFYSHLYNDEDLIVIFKNKVFHVKTHSSTWSDVLQYGLDIGIPLKQLDFWPNRFQDEGHYFD